MYNRRYSRFTRTCNKNQSRFKISILQPSFFHLSFWIFLHISSHPAPQFTHNNTTMVVLYPLPSIGGQTMFMYIETSWSVGSVGHGSMFQSVGQLSSPQKDAPQMGMEYFFVESHKLGHIQFILFHGFKLMLYIKWGVRIFQSHLGRKLGMVQSECEENQMNSLVSLLRYLNSKCPSSPICESCHLLWFSNRKHVTGREPKKSRIPIQPNQKLGKTSEGPTNL